MLVILNFIVFDFEVVLVILKFIVFDFEEINGFVFGYLNYRLY